MESHFALPLLKDNLDFIYFSNLLTQDSAL